MQAWLQARALGGVLSLLSPFLSLWTALYSCRSWDWNSGLPAPEAPRGTLRSPDSELERAWVGVGSSWAHPHASTINLCGLGCLVRSERTSAVAKARPAFLPWITSSRMTVYFNFSYLPSSQLQQLIQNTKLIECVLTNCLQLLAVTESKYKHKYLWAKKN